MNFHEVYYESNVYVVLYILDWNPPFLPADSVAIPNKEGRIYIQAKGTLQIQRTMLIRVTECAEIKRKIDIFINTDDSSLFHGLIAARCTWYSSAYHCP